MSSSGSTPGEIVIGGPRSFYLKAAALLVLIAGIVCFVNGAVAVFSNSALGFGLGFDINRYSICGVLVVIFGFGAILGSIVSILIRRASPALAGAAFGMAGGGLLGFWCGLAALVLLVLSDEDL